MHRGFRSWDTHYYAGDNWKVSSNLNLQYGLRYQPGSRPVEVNDLNRIPYDSDRNNFAPQVGFAYRLPQTWGVLRAAYGLHFGEIFPVTFQQVRFSPPGSVKIVVTAPSLVDPLGSLTQEGEVPNPRGQSLSTRSRIGNPVFPSVQLKLGAGVVAIVEAAARVRGQSLTQAAYHVVHEQSASRARYRADDRDD